MLYREARTLRMKHQNIHAKIPDNEVLLRETVEQLIRDEQEDVQELTQLTGDATLTAKEGCFVQEASECSRK